jgi:anti-anti-sigma regulatory factor
MFNVKKEKDRDLLRLVLSGFLDIGNVSAIKDELSVLGDLPQKLEVKIEQVENIDLSFLQLMVAFKKEHPDCQITFNWDLDQEFFRIIQGAGFVDVL